jgi:hypothetical protein
MFIPLMSVAWNPYEYDPVPLVSGKVGVFHGEYNEFT